MNEIVSTVQQSTSAQQISALTERLAPAGDEVVKSSILSLLRMGLVLPQNMEASDMAAAYGFALAKVSIHGIKAATAKIARGEYQRDFMDIIPRPPEFAALARAEEASIRADLVRIRETEASRLLCRSEPKNEETKARIRELVASAKSALTPSKEKVETES